MLGYTVYATSFYDVTDAYEFVDKLLVPSDINDFSLKSLEDIALDYVDDVDYIIFTSDVDTTRFPKSKVIGNYNTDLVNNKFKLYKFLHKNFLLPKTYKLNDMDEAQEIVLNNPNKKYVIKPVYGTGGLNIHWFNRDVYVDDEFLLQEYVYGDSVSSSFLSYPNHEIEFITSSEQIIGSKMLGARDFTYCGNITPYINSSSKIKNISTKISRMCKLVGSNGIDFVVDNNKVYVLEVNPRIQGSFECVERSFNMNLAKAHMDVYNNIPVNIPKVKQFCVKLIAYARNNGMCNLENIPYVYDKSDCSYIFRKGEPIATIIVSDRILENAMSKAERIRKSVYNSFI